MAERAEYEARAEAGLPDERRVTERNAAITSRYATLYRDHRALFKWAGMAAFGSHRIGVVLAPYCVVEGRPPLERLVRRGPFVFDDLELIRRTNNAIYRDIAWAHHAYLDEGLGAVERLVGDAPDHARLLEGFRLLDRGRATNDAGLVWRGNEKLLEHEQAVVVQYAFDRLDADFRALLAVTTALDFDADEWRIDLRTNSAFYLYMWTRGLPLLRETRALPSYVRFDHRWYWLSRRVLPTWQEVDRDELGTARHIDAMIGRATST